MKNIGVIGGLGPLATVDFFKKIVVNTDARSDQENIPILIYNNPQIPDRTDAIINNGTDPVPEIIRTANILEDMGADFLCMPCNTSFYFYDEVIKGINVPLINMVELTSKYIKQNNYNKVCVLGTKGTILSRIYYDELDKLGVSYLELDDDTIAMINYLIFNVVKSNNYNIDISKFRDRLNEIVDKYEIDAFVLACTELPVLFEKFNLNFNRIDPTEILALEAIRIAKEG